MKGQPCWRIAFDWPQREPWLELPFPEDEFRQRVARIRARMDRDGLDALVVYGGPGDVANMRYVTNYAAVWGDSLIVIPREGEVAMATDAIFHGEPMHSNVHTTWVRDFRPIEHAYTSADPGSPADEAADILRSAGVDPRRTGLAGRVRCPEPLFRRLIERLGTVPPDASRVLEDVRAIKSPLEQAAQREACRITDRALEAAYTIIGPGVTEAEVAARIYETGIRLGAESVYYMQVAGGARGSIKNCRPSMRALEDGEIVSLDIMMTYAGYFTDTHRSFMIGRPSELQRRMLEATLRVEDLVLEHVRPGVKVADLQALALTAIRRHGFEDNYYDFLGHGCGLSMVERPHMFSGSQEILAPGMTFFLEPMVVVHGLATVCFEDLVLVTADGCETLSKCERKTWS